MNAPALRAEHRQQQALSPRLQHAVRLLQMSSLDFAQQVHAALGRNPFLEPVEGEADADAAGDDVPAAADAAGDADAAPALATEAELRGELDAGIRTDEDRDTWQGDALGGRRREDGETSGLDTMAVETSLASHLLGQLQVMPLPQRELAIGAVIVESLDDDGYLRTPLEELADVYAFEPPCELDELKLALCRVQALEPAGVAARSVQECLLLQLKAMPDDPAQPLARRLVADHLEALAAKDASALARKLGGPLADVEAACALVRRLDPRPGWRYGAAHIQYVTPDVIVRKLRGRWVATLNPAIVPKVRLNQVYAELFQRHRSAQNGELAAHLQEARWTLRNVEQRFSTIVSVAQAILDRQHNFLDFGPMAMRPLGLREIALETGVHESTVSRVTNNKYMATPAGTFELKYFFSRAMNTSAGGECSPTAIRELVKDMIDGEQPTAPLSDAEIARRLARQGLVVARRTVTKYRQQMRVEAVDKRKAPPGRAGGAAPTY